MVAEPDPSAEGIDDGVRWTLRKPDMFTDLEMIEAAKQAYMEIADHNPQTMGKSKACYSALIRITTIYARFAQQLAM